MKILLIGCGHMGGAMLAGWLRPEHAARIERVEVVSPSGRLPERVAAADGRVRVHAAPPAGIDADLAVLAVKPQVTGEACAALAPILPADIPVMSIAAGVSLARLASLLGGTRPLVRAMPNTPGAVGKGITGYCVNQNINEKQLDNFVFLLSALGKTVQIPDEAQMDAVTALSGSGPAYVYAFVEALEKAGIEAGLSPEVSSELARETVSGAAALMAASGESPARLRREVTSPGGTTEAALDVLLENHALDRLVNEAVTAARKRAQTLG